jgi:Second Messenger Oligonucleotide or Dinucleotide Synthetase domain
MATYPLPDHFASFFRKLNPSLSFEATASSQYNSIKGLLEDSNGAAAILEPSCFLQGSYRQQTAIHSINDIDIVALCKLSFPGSGSGRSFGRDEIFHTIAAPLIGDNRYASKVRYGPNSMCIKIDLSIKVEILPVVYLAGNSDSSNEPFKLFRPSTHSWEDGFARYHQAYLSLKNKTERTGGNFIPAIKVFKHMRTIIGLPAVSFHLECLLYSIPDYFFLGSPSDYIPALLEKIVATDSASWYKQVLKTPCRRVSTTLRQVLTEFSEFFICSIKVSSFHKKFRARIA